MVPTLSVSLTGVFQHASIVYRITQHDTDQGQDRMQN